MFYDCYLAFVGEDRLATLVHTSHPPKIRKKRPGHYVRGHV